MSTHRFFSRAKVTLAGLLIVAIVAPAAAFPRPAHAIFGVGDIVIDPSNLVQNTLSAFEAIDGTLLDRVLDPLAWMVAKVAIQSMTKSVVNWINGGFQGSPAFEQDLNKSLRLLGDGIAQEFVTQLRNDERLHSPFIDDLVTNVGTAYYLYSGRDQTRARLQYTLDKAAADDKAFLKGDFNQGGWDGWFAAFSQPGNNPYGAQMEAAKILANNISGAANQRVEELSWGSGFLSWRGDCIKDSDGSDAVALAEIDKCQQYSVQTPGSVIEQTLIPNLNSPLHQLELADSFNEIVGALARQLVSKVLGGGGLRGVSQPSQGGGSSALTQATDASEYSSAVSGSISSGFVTNISTTLKQVQEFRADWVSLQAAANAAKEMCANDSATLADPIGTTLATAATNIARADAAIEKLTQLSTKAAALSSGGSNTAGLVELSTDYQTYTASGQNPSAEEIANAAANTLDTGTKSPSSLITTLTKLAQPGCRSN